MVEERREASLPEEKCRCRRCRSKKVCFLCYPWKRFRKGAWTSLQSFPAHAVNKYPWGKNHIYLLVQESKVRCLSRHRLVASNKTIRRTSPNVALLRSRYLKWVKNPSYPPLFFGQVNETKELRNYSNTRKPQGR
jgi:hypothetical protein